MVTCKKCGGETFKVIESKKDFTNNVRVRKKLCMECHAVYMTIEKLDYEIKKTA